MAKKIKKRTALSLPPRVLGELADRVAKTLIRQLPDVLSRRGKKRNKKPKARVKVDNALFLDTSAIIDGRILEVARLGFLYGIILVPKFILLELKHIADSQDSLRRTRGRRGLEILSDLKKIKRLKLKIIEDDLELPEVDEKLIQFAKLYKGRIVTCDYNLNKKATVEGVAVLNVNELANSLKTIALPGEELEVKLVQEGKTKGQGVGYLLDGTMIVVEDGKDLIGKDINVIVSRIFQTAAGRMIFAKVKE